jgi:hypothetical protein
MIPAPLSVLGLCTGSDRSLSRTLSTVERLHSQSSHANPRLPYLRSWKYLLHLPTRPFFPRILHRKLQKAIQYPGIRSGSVQCILSAMLTPGVRAPRTFQPVSITDRMLFIIVLPRPFKRS